MSDSDGWIWDHYPEPGMTNGFHRSVGVNVYNGKDVIPCYFQYYGGDELYPEIDKTPTFKTDEGLPINNVICWQPLPPPPKKRAT